MFALFIPSRIITFLFPSFLPLNLTIARFYNITSLVLMYYCTCIVYHFTCTVCTLEHVGASSLDLLGVAFLTVRMSATYQNVPRKLQQNAHFCFCLEIYSVSNVCIILHVCSSISPIREIQLELILLQFVVPTLLEHGNSRAGLKFLIKHWARLSASLL